MKFEIKHIQREKIIGGTVSIRAIALDGKATEVIINYKTTELVALDSKSVGILLNDKYRENAIKEKRKDIEIGMIVGDE